VRPSSRPVAATLATDRPHTPAKSLEGRGDVIVGAASVTAS